MCSNVFHSLIYDFCDVGEVSLSAGRWFVASVEQVCDLVGSFYLFSCRRDKRHFLLVLCRVVSVTTGTFSYCKYVL